MSQRLWQPDPGSVSVGEWEDKDASGILNFCGILWLRTLFQGSLSKLKQIIIVIQMKTHTVIKLVFFFNLLMKE